MDAVEMLAAKRFVLVDDQGAPRAELTTNPDGLVGLHVYGKGDSSASVSVGINDEDGTPAVFVRGPSIEGQGNGAVVLGVTPDGGATLGLRDADRTERYLFANEANE
jgi:hypothetical protein